VARDRYDKPGAAIVGDAPTIHERWRNRMQEELATAVLNDAVRDHLAGAAQPGTFSRAVLEEFYRAYKDDGLERDRVRARSGAELGAIGRGLLTFIRDYERELRAGTSVLPPAPIVHTRRSRGALYGGG
jgi:hypothetical protein